MEPHNSFQLSAVNISSDNIQDLDFCLLIPCYNDLEGLVRCISSVCYHPARFRIVIVDDGSDPAVSFDAIKHRIPSDHKVVLLKNETNEGITNALNKGLAWIQQNTHSRYVARLDCNDVCRHDRFFKQVVYLDQHPEVGLLGSWCEFEDSSKRSRYAYRTPTDHADVLKAMYFKNIFIHPTVMFRTALLANSGYYPYQFPYAEDYAFFWRLIKISAGHILGEFLVVCEINHDGISLKNRKRQFRSRIKVINTYGKNSFLRLCGIMRIMALTLIPASLALRLKNLIKS